MRVTSITPRARRGHLPAALVGVLVLAEATGYGGTHFAIITNLANAPKEKAFIEVAADVLQNLPGSVTVFRAGGSTIHPVTLNAQGWATTTNLLVPDDPDLLVSIGGIQSVSAVTLRQEASGNNLIQAIPLASTAAGKAFRFAVGPSGTSYLIIANVSPTADTAVEISGAASDPPAQPGLPLGLSALSVQRFKLTTTGSMVSVRSLAIGGSGLGEDIIVLYAVDVGKVSGGLVPAIPL